MGVLVFLVVIFQCTFAFALDSYSESKSLSKNVPVYNLEGNIIRYESFHLTNLSYTFTVSSVLACKASGCTIDSKSVSTTSTGATIITTFTVKFTNPNFQLRGDVMPYTGQIVYTKGSYKQTYSTTHRW